MSTELNIMMYLCEHSNYSVMHVPKLRWCSVEQICQCVILQQVVLDYIDSKNCLHLLQVHGRRFVYKFVCDLRMLLGYTAGDLNRLVTECTEKKLFKVRENLRAGLVRNVVEHIIEPK